MENAYGNTPLDLVLGTDEYEQTKGLNIMIKNKLDPSDKKLDPTISSYTNLSQAAILFNQIKDYSDHHSGPLLVDAVIAAIKN